MGVARRGNAAGVAAAAAAAAVAAAAGQATETGAAAGPWWAGGQAWAPTFQIEVPQLPQFQLPVWDPAAAVARGAEQVQRTQQAAADAVANYQEQVGNFYSSLQERTSAALGSNPLFGGAANGSLFGPAIPLNNWPTLQLPQFPQIPGMELEWSTGAAGAPANQPGYGQQAEALMLSQVCNVYKPDAGVSEWTPGQNTIRVTDEFSLDDLRVEVYAKHPRVGALRVSLITNNQGQDPRRAFLKVKGQGGKGENLIGTVFADSGGEFPKGPESTAEAPFTNTYAPFAEGGLKGKFVENKINQGLKATTGGSAGSWTLKIEDMSNNPVDALIEDWTLTLCRKATDTAPLRLTPQQEIAEFNGVLETNIACPPTEPGCPLGADGVDLVMAGIFDDEVEEKTDLEAAQAGDGNPNEGWTSEGAASADPEVRAQAVLGGGGAGVAGLKYWEEQSEQFFSQLQAYYDANMPSPVYNFLTTVPDEYWQMMIYYQMWSWWKEAELPAERAGKNFKGFHMPKLFPHHGA